MYRPRQADKATARGVTPYAGETIEAKIRRILSNKEPIKDGAESIYTDRKDGVLAGTDIRTDRFEVAIDAMEKVSQEKVATRAKVMEMRNPKKKEEGKEGTEGGKSDNTGGKEAKSGDPSQ